MPTYKDVSENYPEFYFFELESSHLPDDERSAVLKKCGGGVPCTIYMVDGRYKANVKGNISPQSFKDWLDELEV
jgi:hypothetical protein